MYTKEAVTLFVVSIFLLCPILAICVDSEADSDGTTENATTIRFVDAPHDKVKNVFRYDETSFMNSMYIGSVKTTVLQYESVNISYGHVSTGAKISFDGSGVYNATTLVENTAEFDIVFKAIASGVGFTFASSDFISGEGISDLKSLLTTYLSKDSTVVLHGSVSQKSGMKIRTDSYHNSALGYISTKNSTERYDDFTFSGTIEMLGYKVEIKQNMLMDAFQYADDVFDVAIEDVKAGDKGKEIPGNMEFKKFDVSNSISFDGFKRAVTFDEEKYKKAIIFYSERDISAEFKKTVDVSVTSQMLSGLNSTLSGKSMDYIKPVVEQNGGTFSTDVSLFNNEFDRVTISFGGGNDYSNIIKYAIIIAVIIAAAVVIVRYVL